MKYWPAAIIALTCLGVAPGWSVRAAFAQTEAGWVSLFDGCNLDDWTPIGDANIE